MLLGELGFPGLHGATVDKVLKRIFPPSPTIEVGVPEFFEPICLDCKVKT